MKKILLMLVALIATSFSAMAEDVYIVAGSEELTSRSTLKKRAP